MSYSNYYNPENAARLLNTPSLLGCEENFEIMPPQEHDSKLSFQVLCNGTPIAYARLKKEEADQRYENRVVQIFSARRAPTYCLKMIQVSQNYRNQGIGALLMQEVIHYCRHHNIFRIVGEMQGEIPALQRWYKANGFTVHADRSIEMLLPGL